MNLELLTNALRDHFNRTISLYIFAAALMLVLVAYNWIKGKKFDGYCLWMMSAFIPLILLFCMNVIPVINDLEQQDYVTAEIGYYYRYPNGSSSHNWFKKSRVVIELDDTGKCHYLYLPSGTGATGAKDDFPMGKYTGTVIYAKRSKILLYFEPQSEIIE